MGKKPVQITAREQEAFLQFFASTPKLRSRFYFTGGTALSKFYLQHRFSEDLDFFSSEEFSVHSITPFIRKAKTVVGFSRVDYQQLFNRFIFHLIFSPKKTLKIEFTYFPFIQVEPPKKVEGLRIDSLVDIAVNKVFTIAQNPRGRDFFDLYLILKKTQWDIFDLLKKARIKFDWYIDWLQFGSQLFKVKELKDDPILGGQKVNFREIESYFVDLAKKLEKKVLKK